jgi:hypothetical protein
VSGGMPPGAPDILGDLEFLEHHWGSAYLIGAEDAGYAAVRRDGKGTKLVAADRDGLLGKIQADYAADPVSRDLPETAAPPGITCRDGMKADPLPEPACAQGRDHRPGDGEGMARAAPRRVPHRGPS